MKPKLFNELVTSIKQAGKLRKALMKPEIEISYMQTVLNATSFNPQVAIRLVYRPEMGKKKLTAEQRYAKFGRAFFKAVKIYKSQKDS